MGASAAFEAENEGSVAIGVAVNELEPNEQMIKRCEKVGSFAPLRAK